MEDRLNSVFIKHIGKWGALAVVALGAGIACIGKGTMAVVPFGAMGLLLVLIGIDIYRYKNKGFRVVVAMCTSKEADTIANVTALNRENKKYIFEYNEEGTEYQLVLHIPSKKLEEGCMYALLFRATGELNETSFVEWEKLDGPTEIAE